MTSRPWGSVQPPLAAPLDRSDSLWVNLAGFWHFNAGGGTSYEDLLTGRARALTSAGTVTPQATPRGVGIKSDGTTGVLSRANITQFTSPNPLTIWWAGYINTANNGTKGLIGFRTDFNFYIMHLNATSVEARITVSSVQTDASFSTGVTTGFHTIGLTYNGTTLVSYLDGNVKTSTAGSTALFTGTTTGIQILCDGGSSNFSADPTLAAALWGRALRADEFIRLHADLFAPYTVQAFMRSAVVVPPQKARPSADVSGVWTQDDLVTTTNLYTRIDETTANDADFIQSPTSATSSEQKIRLDALADPGTTSGHIIRAHYRKDLSFGSTIDLTVNLYAADGTTLIATRTYTDITTSVVEVVIALTGPEAASIPSGDYATGLVLGFASTQTYI